MEVLGMEGNVQFRRPPFFAPLFGCLLVMATACPSSGGTPVLSIIGPRGIQRGAEADMLFRGVHFQDAREILFYSSGITVTSFQIVDPTLLKVHVRVGAEARIGEYCARVRGDTGISDVRTFYITPFPILRTVQGAHVPLNTHRDCDFDHPELIKSLNVTMNGFVLAEQPHYFAVDMKKGQRLTAEVHGMRLGDKFDTYLAILDQKRFELAISDDTALAMQDSIASTIIPADGRYIIVLRETAYAQGSFYLLHIGTFPRPSVVYPLGGRPGEELRVKYLGDVAGPIDATIRLPNETVDSCDVFPDQNGLIAPSPNHMRISDMPNVMEQEPNNDFSTATAYAGDLPVAFNGIIDKAGDIDYFRFKAKKGQELDIRVIARTLRSPIDSVLYLYDARGHAIANNDDSGGPDSYIHFNVPADGEYGISITDQLHQGGVDYAYRVEISPVKPELALTIPGVNLYSQDRWTVPVPRGNRYATLMRATRNNTGGDVTIGVRDMPEGISMRTADGDQNEVLIVFEARPDAPLGGKICQVTAELSNGDKKVDVTPTYQQKITLVIGPNNTTLYSAKINSLAVAVTKEAPFRLHLEQPKVPLVQGGAMELSVSAERAEGFNGPIQVRLLFHPPGVTALPTEDIASGQSMVRYPLNAQANAPLHTWKTCVVGVADVNGEVWVSSELIDLEVGEPYVLASTRMTAVEQGKTGTVTYKLEQKIPFSGKAKARLMGLPINVIAGDAEISGTDTTVSFPVSVAANAAPGVHATLFCNVVIMKDGQPIIHNVGRGGPLRVDIPADVKSSKPGAVAERSKSTKSKPADAKPGNASTSATAVQKSREGQK
jgi:hypothetical protein